MLRKLKELPNKRYFHIIILTTITLMILFVGLLVILRYSIEGEKNLPFELSKISIISTSQGINKDTTDSKWAFDLVQNNDIYLYIEKNQEYYETEIINNIKIDNIVINSSNNQNVKIYKPDIDVNETLFKNEEDNLVNSIEYKGAMENNIKNLEISNQGGIAVFRCANENLGEYKSNEDIINHNELLKLAGISNESLKITISFDLVITLEDKNEYSTNVNLELPINDIVETGISSIELTDMSDYVFKKTN